MINDNLNIFIALGAVATTISIIWLFSQAMTTRKQFIKYSKDKERDNDYDRKKYACDMAKFFAEEVVPLTIIVEGTIRLNEDAYRKLLIAFPSNKLKRFDKWEMDELLAQAELDQKSVADTFNNIDVNVVYRIMLGTGISIAEKAATLRFYTDIETDVRREQQLLNDYVAAQTALLNKLEWFSMMFQYKIADEETVYQSLHQIFLSSVNLMYYHIASVNVYVPDKYYTNIIWLYNRWHNRLEKDQAQQLRREKDAKTPIREASPTQ